MTNHDFACLDRREHKQTRHTKPAKPAKPTQAARLETPIHASGSGPPLEFLYDEGTPVRAIKHVALLWLFLGVISDSSHAQQITDLPVEEFSRSPQTARERGDLFRRQLNSPTGERGESGLNSPQNSARVLPESATRLITKVEFDNVPLAQAMQTLSKEVGLNVISSAQAGQQPITVYLEEVTAIDAIDAIVKANGLFYRIEDQSGIIRIATRDEYVSDLTNFREEETRVFTLLYPNPTAVAQAIQHMYGNRVQLNQADNDFQDLIELTQRFNKFDIVDGRALGLGTFGGGLGGSGLGGGLGSGIGGGLGAFGGGLNGIGGGQGAFGFGLTNRSRSRVNVAAEAIEEREEQRELFKDVLQEIENARGNGGLTDEQQAEISRRSQATIFVSTIRRNNQVVVRTSDPNTMEQIAQLIAQLDVPTPTVLLEVKVLRVELADGLNSAFEYFGGDTDVAGAFSDGTPFSVPPAVPFPGGTAVSRTLGEGLGISGNVPGALTFQVIDDNFRFRMQLLESKNRVTALASPLILTANNEVSRIFVGDTLPFTVGFTPGQIVGGVVGGVGGAVAPTPITELRDVGQSLLITPNINSDRTVTLRIVEENSERILGGASIPVPSTDGTTVTTVNVDTVRRRSVTGTVVAQDGMAVALGGLIEEQVTDTRDQIPILGDIPKIGFLFRRQATGRQRSELIVMVRPYIFNTPAEAAQRSQCVVSENSLHPSGPDPVGSMNTYLPCEVIRPDPECTDRACLLRLHNVVPAIY